jgi:hypothetical protein
LSCSSRRVSKSSGHLPARIRRSARLTPRSCAMRSEEGQSAPLSKPSGRAGGSQENQWGASPPLLSS